MVKDIDTPIVNGNGNQARRFGCGDLIAAIHQERWQIMRLELIWTPKPVSGKPCIGDKG